MRTKKILFLLLLLVFFSFTTGCLGSLFNNKPIIESIPETTAKVGIEYTYEIEATDPDADDVLTYSLTEKPTGMTINETTGAVSWTPTEAQVGEHQVIIEVSDGKVSVSQNFTITVAEALLDSIVVLPSTMSIYVGDTEPVTSVTAYYDNETSASIGLSSASYISDDTDVATVNSSGLVTGVSAGTVTITVSYTEDSITKTDTISVTVPLNLSNIKVLPEFMHVFVGSSQSITSIKAYYEGSTTPANIALNDAIYISNHPTIASVNTSGVVTGVSASEDWQTITVSYTEGSITKTDTVYVKVEEAPVILTSLTVLPETREIVVGDTEEITEIIAIYSDETTANIPSASDDVSYSSDDDEIATVTDLGVVTGVSVGTATITVSYTEAGITETDTVAVTVVAE